MRISALFASAALCGGIWMGGLSAATVETDPVGAMAITLLGNSDTIVSVPFHRPIEFEGKIQSITNIDEVNETALITVTSTPAWAANQFVHNGNVQPNTYYVLMASGQNEGMYYTVTANGSNTLTIDTAGDDVTTIQTVVADGDGMGDIVRVIPYWTLNTLFPEGGGVFDTTSPSGAIDGVSLIVPNTTQPGINIAATRSYYYYTGSSFGGPGWRGTGVPVSQIQNNQVLPPDVYYIMRKIGEGDVQIILAGAVPMHSFSTPVGTLEADREQDNFVANPSPVPVTLSESKLYESGAIKGSPNIGGSGADFLLVFDNQFRSINKASSVAYFYYTGSNYGGPGWRRLGASVSQIFDNDMGAALEPSQGYLIRKAFTASPNTSLWRFKPNYLQ